MSLHIITQRNQPYGSTRKCCEICGLSIIVILEKIDESFTDNTSRFCNSPLSCNKNRLIN
jgi:hypothetical protein